MDSHDFLIKQFDLHIASAIRAYPAVNRAADDIGFATTVYAQIIGAEAGCYDGYLWA